MFTASLSSIRALTGSIIGGTLTYLARSYYSEKNDTLQSINKDANAHIIKNKEVFVEVKVRSRPRMVLYKDKTKNENMSKSEKFERQLCHNEFLLNQIKSMGLLSNYIFYYRVNYLKSILSTERSMLKIGYEVSNAELFFFTEQYDEASNRIKLAVQEVSVVEEQKLKQARSVSPNIEEHFKDIKVSVYNMSGIVERGIARKSNVKEEKISHGIKARESFMRALQERRDPNVLSNLGLFYDSSVGNLVVEQMRPEERSQDLLLADCNCHKIANSLSPDNPSIANGLAFCLYRMGDGYESYRRYSHALRLESGNRTLFNNRAWLLLDASSQQKNSNFSKMALSDCDAALQIGQNGGVAMFLKGIAYSHLGEYEKALESLESSTYSFLDEPDKLKVIADYKEIISKAKFDKSPAVWLKPKFPAYDNIHELKSFPPIRSV